MTTPLIEAIARAIAASDKTEVTFPPTVGCHTRRARAAFAALEAAGYIAVPVEATEAMLNAGLDSEDCDGWSGPLSCWERMISAAQGDG